MVRSISASGSSPTREAYPQAKLVVERKGENLASLGSGSSLEIEWAIDRLLPGNPRDPHDLRRATDRLGGGPDTPGGAGRDAPGHRARGLGASRASVVSNAAPHPA